MQPLQLFEAPLAGMNLIEASAGTGKTYTITALYLRMLLEKSLPVENILVVTFTKAATAELKERLRSRLVAVRRVFERGEADDDFSRTLLEQCPDPEQGYRLLNRAVLDFDRAAIFTIHGFCQRVLAESAFESGRPFHMGLVSDEQELVQEVVDDFWRLHIQDQSAGFQDYLLSRRVSPDYLAGLLRGRLGRPYMVLRGQPAPEGMDKLEAAFDRLFARTSREWAAGGEEVVKLLRDAKGLNGNKYRKGSIENWCRQMDSYLGAVPGPWFDNFTKFTTATLQASLKKGGIAPEHSFFDLCGELLEQREQQQQGYENLLISLQVQLVDYVNRELAERKESRGVQSYNDLLLHLDQALNGKRGEALTKALKQRYGAALIDEFQDTDPIQYRIFSRIYAGDEAPAYLVGDPKQAIYSFRGADIFAYIEARDDAREQFTLDTNWRSDARLIKGVNALFSVGHGGFLFHEIPFQQALAAPEEQLNRPRLLESGGVNEPLRVGFIAGQPSKELATRWAVSWTAAEINRLLEGGRSGEITLGADALTSKDIAVLVRSHAQGSKIRDALRDYGIYSVLRTQDNVFHSREAQELERVMSAVVEPGREVSVRTALVIQLMGLSGTDIARLSLDETELEGYLETFRHYHQVWREKGFIRMFRLLLREQDLPARLRGMESGERRLTNLLHLGELLHRAERAEKPSMEGLVKWLSHRRSSERAEDEEHQLRLESDEKLVQIVTIHKSKGLQYPVVFAPFAWGGGLWAGGDGTVDYHDPDDNYRAVLDMGSDEWEQSLLHAQREEMSENLRLLYVALTRAQERCYLLWGNVKGAGHSALGWLLHPPADPDALNALSGQEAHFKTLGDDDLYQRLQQWKRDAASGVHIERVDAYAEPPSSGLQGATGESAGELACRSIQREIQRDRRITSFSALTVHGSSVELPDHDAAGPDEETVQEISPPGYDIFSFPRGARPGSCLHAIFEDIDFTDTGGGLLQQVVSEKLAAYGFDEIWGPAVSDMVGNVLNSELEEGVSLGRVTPAKRFVELEFYYPLAPVHGQGLASLLQQHGFGGNSHLERAIEQLRFQDISGYMKGFIDLVFEADGRFYLLDYKSNWLGGTTDDYCRERMEEVMARDYYFLQYLLYTLALHRYLKTRIADYDYERHFGGVHYLFLRGIDANTESRTGIYKDRPERGLVEALEHFICGNGGGR